MDDQGVFPGWHEAARVDEAGYYHAHVEAYEVEMVCGGWLDCIYGVFFLVACIAEIIVYRSINIYIFMESSIADISCVQVVRRGSSKVVSKKLFKILTFFGSNYTNTQNPQKT